MLNAIVLSVMMLSVVRASAVILNVIVLSDMMSVAIVMLLC